MPLNSPTDPPANPRTPDDRWTVKAVLDWTTGHLKRHDSESPRREAELLLAHARGCRRIELYTRYEEPLTDSERATMRDLVRRRAAAEPVAYLVGFKEFFSLPFAVTRDVLIPRPETEGLVMEALEFAKMRRGESLRLLDLCTGSGCVAIAAAHQNKRLEVVASDLSPRALALARENAASNDVAGRVTFFEGDLFAPLPPESRFDIITANPPYVAEADYATLTREIREHEPKDALIAGPDGLDCLRRICEEAPRFLNPGGVLLLELSPEQAGAVAELLRISFEEVAILPDLAGHQRIARAKYRG